MDALFWRRIRSPRILKRIFNERLTEPLHLNMLSLFVALGGGFRSKVAFDLIVRHQNAFGLLRAADLAGQVGVRRVTAIEFGVAAGAGLMNLCRLASRITRLTGVEFEIVGFDTGTGMPEPRDYRDHPEYYRAGDFPMQDRGALLAALPPNAKLILGNIAATVPQFLSGMEAPLGFVSMDVDYYSSTVDALVIFDDNSCKYLPFVIMYLDDIEFDGHNPYCGELGAIEEFNQSRLLRKITKYNFLRQKRIFQRANWIAHMFQCHVLDHPVRAVSRDADAERRIIGNPYIG